MRYGLVHSSIYPILLYPKEGGISDDTKPQYGVMSSSSSSLVFLIRNAKGEMVGVFVSLVVTHETFLVSRMTEYCCPAMAPALYSMCNAYMENVT